MKTTIVSIILTAAWLQMSASAASYTPPASPRVTYSFNPGWKFIRQDVPGAEQVVFDDSKWADVSAPHTYNDVDSYNNFIDHSGGDRRAWTGITWYRKHFKLPAGAKDGKVFLEFEGLKQAGHFWVNGKLVGRFENGVTACGLDLTDFVNFGDADNVIAVKVDNSNNYQEEATGAGFQWMGRAFNPNYGGLNHDIWLHLTGKVYQTLPLYENLKTTGVYIYPSNFSISGKACDVTVESQVRNESADHQNHHVVGGGGGCGRRRARDVGGRHFGFGHRRDGSHQGDRPSGGGAILGRGRSVSLRCLFHFDSGRKSGGRLQNAHRFSPG